ncbi:MAG: inositol monophosphatase family protein [Pelolinea sp.]|nr:inositol monophosphatase family protein [Pelolinea sp.]
MTPTKDFIVALSKGAGDILREGYGKKHQIDHKGPIDLVTEIDRRAEDYIVKIIRESFPTHSIIAEESGVLDGEKEKRWYIDPVDGTSNYASGLPMFAVSIAFAENDLMRLACVYEPLRDECFFAEKGAGAWLNDKPIHVSTTNSLINAMLVTGFPYDVLKKNNNIDHFSNIIREVHTVRRLGSAALDLVYVAAGRLDAYWEIDISPWDIAAGTLIVEEAGGIVTTIHNDPIYMRPPYDVIASNGELHNKLLAFFKDAP